MAVAAAEPAPAAESSGPRLLWSRRDSSGDPEDEESESECSWRSFPSHDHSMLEEWLEANRLAEEEEEEAADEEEL